MQREAAFTLLSAMSAGVSEMGKQADREGTQEKKTPARILMCENVKKCGLK